MKTNAIISLAVIIGLCGILIFAPGVVCSCLIHGLSLLDDHAKIACNIAGVSPIPPNAELLNAGGWNTGFSNQSSCAFKLDKKEEVEEWIHSSPSINGQQPFVFSPSHRLITFSSSEEKDAWEEHHPGCLLECFPLSDHVSIGSDDYHFVSLLNDPKWFKPNIAQGRYFSGEYNSHIFIDDVNDVIWISASSD